MMTEAQQTPVVDDASDDDDDDDAIEWPEPEQTDTDDNELTLHTMLQDVLDEYMNKSSAQKVMEYVRLF